MKFAARLFLFSAIIMLVGCTYKEIYTPTSNVDSRNPDGKIAVYEIGESVNRDHTIIGTLELKDSGATLRCGYFDGLILAKERAREIGADAVVVKSIKRPDFISTCDRLVLDIIEFN